MRLGNKIAIITGAAGGIGSETAKRFLGEGAKVVLADLNVEAATAMAQKLDESGEHTLAASVDVTSAESVTALFKKAVNRFGGVDILVNNAGATLDARLVNMTEEQFDKAIAINLKGTFLCGQAAAKTMMAQQRGGAIVNIASLVGIYGNFGQSNYVAAKAGIIGMTKTWSKELGKYMIRSNAVAPGFILTGMTEKMPPNVLDGMKEKCPMKMLGSPKHIADACLFLASSEAEFVNGAILEVTGGLAL
ncbi:MAG TPA: 3-oxoacyl-ACP reductase FabG [Clostridia bacterium]|nr:3-oxoacyl-ACP reductase FabG [Clostridia bacterium]